MICTLTQDGKTVGITANSHKVIRNILDEVLRAAPGFPASIDCVQKVSDLEPNLDHLQFTTDNATFLAEIGTNSQVGGATAWLWARPDAFECVDTLFIDEAAQMSLANVLAVSQAAKNVVLLGDPQQLEQPIQGSHPEGTDVSALSHILGTHATIPPDRGLFLDERARWTLRLLENKVVELGIVDRASDSTIGRALKKTLFSPIAASTGSSRRRPTARL